MKYVIAILVALSLASVAEARGPRRPVRNAIDFRRFRAEQFRLEQLQRDQIRLERLRLERLRREQFRRGAEFHFRQEFFLPQSFYGGGLQLNGGCGALLIR